MLLKDFKPAPDVSDFVQLYRIIHLEFDGGQDIPIKAYPPRPEHCLAFYPHDTETVEYKNSGKLVKNLRTVVYGQFSEVTNRIIGQHFLVFQVIFYPGALFRLTGIPATELTNNYIDAECIFSTRLRDVNEQLYDAKAYPEMINIVDEFVRGLVKKQRVSRQLIDDACTFILNSHGKTTIDEVAKQACLCTRQLERKFKERTGVNPKLYQRIIRFDKVFRMKNTYPQFDWLRIAMECDYHDYQHLVKDYKDFTGLAPAAFHQIEDNAPERKFGLNEGYYK